VKKIKTVPKFWGKTEKVKVSTVSIKEEKKTVARIDS